MLSSIFEFFLIVFALIGLVALVRRVFRTNWHFGYKAVVLFVSSFLGLAIINDQMAGALGQDHGTLVALFATGGLVIFLVWAIFRTNDWRYQAGFVVAGLVVMGAMWYPVFVGGHSGMPPSPLQGVHPAVPIAGSTPSIQSQPTQRTVGRSKPTNEECEQLAYEDRHRLNCP